MKFYGSIQHDARTGQWVLHVEPHVVLRMKRVFGRISAGQHQEIRITDTVESSRDLQWFIQRYPVKFENRSDRDRLDARAAEHRECESLVSKLVAGSKKPRRFKLALPPRDYQRVAADLLLRLGGLLIADDLGIGKTVTAICALTDPRTRPALVVAPAHLQHQWREQLSIFAPELRAHILRRGTPYDITRSRGTHPWEEKREGELPDVIITSYSKLHGWAGTLAPLLRSVFFDEVQELRRGEDSAKGRSAYFIAHSCEFRCGLSATPIYNYGGEFYAVMEALRPGALGTWPEFNREWCVGYADRPKISEPKAFGTYLREHGLMIRRTRQEVGRELPGVIRIPHYVESNRKALDDIHSAAAELARIILVRAESYRGEKRQASERLDNMVRQATGIAKAPYVADFVRMLVESGEPVVLYGWHRAVYDLWMERLADLKPALFTGTESPAQKERSRQLFISGETRLLVMSLRAGSGLDGLQKVCRTVAFGEIDWSHGVHEQCIGRAERDGQTEKVAAYFLLSNTGSDPIMADVLGVKRSQLEGVRDPYGALVEKLDSDGDRVRRLAAQYLESKRQSDNSSQAVTG